MDQQRRRVAGPIDAYDEQPKQEYVKCVVVGDGGVGKTRLICSYVFNQTCIPLERLNQGAHHPSVFAIDQYMVDSGIRERGNVKIDGVPVCLRIWDTFGDHEKNRRFAYQDAHVVIICFSIGMISSLRSVNSTWYPEIKKYCPRAPVILVGTQQDRRFIDPDIYRQLSKVIQLKCMTGSDRTPESTILPESGRQTSREIGSVCYLEASIVTKYGVDEVFENALRAALISKGRNRAMFSSNLRRVCKPKLQVPYLPPPNKNANVYVPQCMLKNDLFQKTMAFSGYAHVTFMVEGELIPCQLITLLTADTGFLHVMTDPHVLNSITGSSMLPCDLFTPHRTLKLQSGYLNGIISNLPRGVSAVDTFVAREDEPFGIIVKLENVSVVVFKAIIEFLSTGIVNDIHGIDSLLEAAVYLQIFCLEDNILSGGSDIVTSANDDLLMKRMKAVMNSGFYSDVEFELENGSLSAHKFVLVSQCEVMAAMFHNHHFRESFNSKVDFQSANRESFGAVLEYFYTGQITTVNDPFGTVALANYLGLPRLVAVVERGIVHQIEEEVLSPVLIGKVLDLLACAELHNAPQLVAFCLTYLSTNYNALHQSHALRLKQLAPDNIKYIEKHRWPPVWYLKEQDYYLRTVTEQQREQEKKLSRCKKRRKYRCF